MELQKVANSSKISQSGTKKNMLSTFYNNLPENIGALLDRSITRGLANGTGEARIFFRADDVGKPGKQFNRLIETFKKNSIPLCLAVVPTWLTTTRFDEFLRLTGKKSSQWCWHQHGWRHQNHETSGKKQEFGPGRPAKEQFRDLANGKKHLQNIMGNSFSPFFTPPWNRCSIDTLHGLHTLKFQAVSRSINAKPFSPPELPDIQISIDLHTRKETDPKTCLNNLLKEMERSISNSYGGIMIHHQLMDQNSFDFLDLILRKVRSSQRLHPVSFSAFK
jgi:hypothetical protein